VCAREFIFAEDFIYPPNPQVPLDVFFQNPVVDFEYRIGWITPYVVKQGKEFPFTHEDQAKLEDLERGQAESEADPDLTTQGVVEKRRQLKTLSKSPLHCKGTLPAW